MHEKLSLISNKIAVSFFVILFLIMGTTALFFGIPQEQKVAAVIENNMTVSATITRVEVTITERPTSKRGQTTTEKTYSGYADYTIGAKSYSDIYVRNFDPKYREGDVVTVYYDPNDPTYITLPFNTDHAIGTWIVFGIIFYTAAIAVIAVTFIRKRKKASEKAATREYIGVVTNVIPLENMTVNGMPAYKVECTAPHPLKCEQAVYTSDPIAGELTHLIGSEIDVKVDASDPTKYFVDVRKALRDYGKSNDTSDGSIFDLFN